jgi:hypothetical protein
MKTVRQFIREKKQSFTVTEGDEKFLDAIENESFHRRSLRALVSASRRYNSTVWLPSDDASGNSQLAPLSSHDAPTFFTYGHENPFIFSSEFLQLPEVQAFLERNIEAIKDEVEYFTKPPHYRTHNYIGDEVLLQSFILCCTYLQAGNKFTYPLDRHSQEDLYKTAGERLLLTNRYLQPPRHPVPEPLVDVFYDNYEKLLLSEGKLSDQVREELIANRAKAVERARQLTNPNQVTPTPAVAATDEVTADDEQDSNLGPGSHI